MIAGFLRSLSLHADRPALEVEGRSYSYAELASRAGAFARAIVERRDETSPLVGVLASRSLSAYAAILGAVGAGKAYLPLNPQYPVERTQYVIDHSAVNLVVVAPEAAACLAQILPLVNRELTIVSDDPSVLALAGEHPRHSFVSAAGLVPLELTAGDDDADSLAYVIYTSGSTGKPKGVAIRRRSASDYARFVADRYEVRETDRVSQFSDLTFDFSVHDLWMCWERGACLCVVPKESMVAPAGFIRKSRITCWASVPSVAGMLSRLRLLKPGSLSTLRMTVFCGEPLPQNLATEWQAAAPQARIENIYGPTEATVAITHFLWEPSRSEARCANGIVPIGWVFAGQRCGVVNGTIPVAPGDTGELVLGGSQVAAGYWRDAERTAERFVALPDLGPDLWYRTGDLVRQDADGCLHFIGRIDNQVKVQGFRVELQEVEHVLRRAAGTSDVVCIPWPLVNGHAEGLFAFVGTSKEEAVAEAQVIARCRATLPHYMVPRRVISLEQGLPMSANGKIDRHMLTAMLKES